MAEVVATTARLRLRTWDEGDADAFYAIMNHAPVMRWLGGVQTRDQWQGAYERIAGFERDFGHTFWIVERIADGKVEKFYQEMVLTEQAFVKDPEKTVGQVLVERGGKEALDLRFVRFKLGEASARTPSEGEALAS